jgi:predicted RNA-binding protein with PUA-like domain
MRDQMQRGDRVLFYHSNASPSAVVGVAKVVRTGYPDHTSWDEADHHYDPASTPANPRWYMVDLKLERKFPRPLSLAELRGLPRLKKMELLRTGSRLSVQPVSPDEFEAILEYSAQPQGGTAPRP